MPKKPKKRRYTSVKNDFLVQKKPLSALIVFSLPIIIGNLFQQVYTMADSAIVGRYVSEQALAAVGASNALTTIFIWVASGGGIGASVIVSRYFGAKKYGEMKTASYTAMLTLLGLSIVLGIVGLVFSRGIMVLMDTPADALEMAIVYLKIYFLGLPFLFMYNVLSSLFNAMGKSRIPLVFLICSSVLNVVLDIYMVRELHMGVAGAAWATLIAQGVSALLSFLVYMRVLRKLEGRAARIFDTTELASMTRIALPSILQQSTVSIGLMLIQSVINGFGSEALAGYSAGMRIEQICIVPMTAMSNAMSSYTAQNIGAGRVDRVVPGYKSSMLIVGFFAVIIAVVSALFCEPISAFFVGEGGSAVAIETGKQYIFFNGWLYFLGGAKMVVDGLLRGAGDMKMFTVANLVNLAARVVLSYLLAPKFGLQVVWMTLPVGWLLNFLISFAQYRTGKWKRIYNASESSPAPEPLDA